MSEAISGMNGEFQPIQVAYRLNGKNYLNWSQLIRTILKGKGKLSHILGTGPKQEDPKFDAWDEEDSMIMAWLWNSMAPEVSNTCMFLPNAKEIWDAIKETYSKGGDAAQIYDLTIKTWSTKQGSQSVTEYANLLKNYWQELDQYRCLTMECSKDAAALKKFLEKERAYQFMAGLNAEFDQVRVQILGKEDMSSLNEVISLVVAEESRRGVMLESRPNDSTAMVSKGCKPHQLTREQGPSDTTIIGRESKDNLWCTFCKKPRHTKEKCWKLHGKPTTSSKDWGYKINPQRPHRQAHVIGQQEEQKATDISSFKAEIERLKCKLEDLEKPTGTGLSAQSDYESLLKTEDGCLGAIQFGYISPKLHELIKIFQSLGILNQVQCLIFVERIITSKVIERFIRKISYLSHFTVSYLTGGNSSADALTPKMQKETLDSFRSRKVNLLFTTDVAEEGIHVPDCSCVIRFDLPKTVRSYVQSCGRARTADSQFVIMLERGNIQQRELLFDIIRSRHSMITTALNRDADAWNSKVTFSETIESYHVESTGATLTADSSISLIYRYCGKLPRDKYFTPKPVFQFSMYNECFQCTLTLPPTAAFQTILGPIGGNSHIAKQLVCLAACKKLHNLGALNDHLLPVIKEHTEVKVDEKEKASGSGAGTKKRKELHSTATISSLSGTWANKRDGIILQGYNLTFSCDLVGQYYCSFILLVDAILDEDVSCTEMDLYLLNKMAKAYVRPCGPVALDMEQVEQAKLFQEFFFNGLFGKLFTGSKSGGQRKFLLNNKESLWSTSNMYLLLPLETSVIGLNESFNIYWKAIRATVSAVEFMRNIYSSGAEFSEALNSCLSRTECGASDMIHLADKSVDQQSLKDMVVLAIHTGKIYSVLDVISNSSADSPFDGNSDKSVWMTFSDYFKKKYGIVLQHSGQPLLLLKQSHNPHNLLSSKSKCKVGSGDKRTNNGGQNHVRMPPELVAHIDVPINVLKSFYLLPSLMHRLESLMLASQLRKEIAFNYIDSSISSALILEAITTLRCCEDFSLERLEHLGDSVLKYAVSCYLFVKYPEKHEDQLSSCRSNQVSNATLHKLGINRNVQGYVRDAAFDPCRWVAPGQISLHPVPCTCGVATSKVPQKVIYEKEDKTIVIGKACDNGHRWMCSKTISDCVEALIGAYYVGGGLCAALAILKWFGIDSEFEPEMFEEAVKAISIRSYLLKINEIQVLEAKLGYNFNVKGLLLEAITHSSTGVDYCYQRLEFLGDSVLDLLITWHLFTAHENLDPGELTDLRSALVKNENFALSAVRHNLQEHLQHSSGFLLAQITEYVKGIQEMHGSKDSLFSKSSIAGPKVLGDMFESIAGAILIDTGLDMDKVWQIFKPLLSPIVTPDNFELPPLRELSELCSELGYFLAVKCIEDGEYVVAELEVQLEVVLLARRGREKNKKAAKAQAAILLLKDMEEKGLSHSRHPSKRRMIEERSVGEENFVASSVQNVCAVSPTVAESVKYDKTSDSDPRPPVNLSVKMKKGGPRSALYELCKKSQWPMPIFESTEEKSSTSPSVGKGERNGHLSFVSSSKLHLPDGRSINCVGERRADKKSSQDSAALALLYELQKQGRCCVVEV